MIKTTLTVRCVLGHEHEVEDDDGKIRLQGYMRCHEPECERNAWVVDTRTEITPETEDDMKHLDATAVCPHCGGSLE